MNSRALLKTALSAPSLASRRFLSSSSSTHRAPKKIGILMMNMGGPRTQDDVKQFLTNIFNDRDILKLPMQ
ncbi:hypothetical protein LPJ66_008482, partial [Kickxella alabastrina]